MTKTPQQIRNEVEKEKFNEIPFWSAMIIANISFAVGGIKNFIMGMLWFIFALFILFLNNRGKGEKRR